MPKTNRISRRIARGASSLGHGVVDFLAMISEGQRVAARVRQAGPERRAEVAQAWIESLRH
jgi:hypothetical protein